MTTLSLLEDSPRLGGALGGYFAEIPLKSSISYSGAVFYYPLRRCVYFSLFSCFFSPCTHLIKDAFPPSTFPLVYRPSIF